MPSEPLWLVAQIGFALAAFIIGAHCGAHREHREWLELYERSNEVILRMLRQLLRNQIQRDQEESTDA